MAVLAMDGEGVVQRSSSPRGLQMQGALQAAATTSVSTVQQAPAAESTGERTAGSTKGGVNIQGNTAINANAQNVNAVTAGRKNAAGNAVGTIGGQ